MYIKNIALNNYRNYDKLYIELDPKLNIFIGQNGQGKTNILEAIFVSGFGKSFRTNKDKELIKMDEEFTHVKMEVQKDYTDFSVEFTMHNKLKKEIKLNGTSLTKRADLIGNLNVVIFSPEDLKLIKEGPTERRKFIDREISNIKRRYCYDLIEYYKVLDQRNHLLKDITRNPKLKSTLDIWDDKLIELGHRLMIERKEFIEKLNILSHSIHKKITDGKENLVLNYLSNIKVKNVYEYDKIYMVYKRLLEEKLESDMRRGFTSVGPHRDDMSIVIDGVDIRSFGSQGQQRTAALSIKLSEVDIIYEEIGEYPVLLMDDVMSELDVRRQNDLIKSFKNIQTLITITDLNSIQDDYKKNAKIFKIENGKVL